MTGQRNYTNGMWYVDIQSTNPISSPSSFPTPIITHQSATPATSLVNSVYDLKIDKDIAVFLHGACCSPVLSTFTKAIDAGYFATWPGLNSKLLRKHLPKQPHTILGHMDQIRQRTRPTTANITSEQDLDSFFTITNPDP